MLTQAEMSAAHQGLLRGDARIANALIAREGISQSAFLSRFGGELGHLRSIGVVFHDDQIGGSNLPGTTPSSASVTATPMVSAWPVGVSPFPGLLQKPIVLLALAGAAAYLLLRK